MTTFLTPKEAAGLGLTTDKPAKFRNRKVALDGYTFDSLKEADRYRQLKDDLRRGEIVNLDCHPLFVVFDGFKVGKKRERPIRYAADFRYQRTSDGQWVVEDVKSEATRKLPTYRMKRKLFLFRYQKKYEFVEVLV